MKSTIESVDWNMLNRIVKPEHQYKDVDDPPLEPIRMAWPFKTEEELRILSKWFKAQDRRTKQKELNKIEKALF